MSSGARHGWSGAVMWGAIAVTVFVLALVAVFRLDPRTAGYAAGALILVCLLTCVAAFSMGSCSGRATARLTDRIRKQPH
jgi:hypothetical protein